MYGGRTSSLATPEMFVVHKKTKRPCQKVEEAYSPRGACESADVVSTEASDAQLVS